MNDALKDSHRALRAAQIAFATAHRTGTHEDYLAAAARLIRARQAHAATQRDPHRTPTTKEVCHAV